MNTDRPIGELDLLAYVDGLLEPQRRAAVEAYLGAHPDEAAWVADCLRQNDLIRELHDGPYHEPLPEPLRRTLDGRAAGHPAAAPSPLRRIAAAVALLLGGGVAGWWIGDGQPFRTDLAQGFVRDMAATHVKARTAERPDAVELVANGGNLLPSLDELTAPDVAPVDAPDLSAHGLALANRRMVPGPSGRAAVQLVYEDVGGRLVSVYLGPRSPERGPDLRLAERSGLAMAYWLTGPFIYGVVGDLPKEEIAAIARSVHQSLHGVGAATPRPLPAGATGGSTALGPAAPPAPAVDEPESPDATEM